MPLKLLIGTLYSGENEFKDCLASIRAQTHGEYEHFVIENLPKREAHDALYRGFMERAGEFDLFLKLDADMVLEQPDVLARIAAWFAQHPDVDCLTVKVFDWLTQQYVDGMHTFRSRVTWPPRDDPVFTDKRPKMGVKVLDDRLFLGAVTHAGNPTPFHAFRFGVHKAWKARAAWPRGGTWRRKAAREHLDNIERVWQHCRTANDPRLEWACLGAELMLAGQWPLDGFDYNCDGVRSVFEAESRCDRSRRIRKARALRRANRWLRGWQTRHIACRVESAVWPYWQPLVQRMTWIKRKLRNGARRALRTLAGRHAPDQRDAGPAEAGGEHLHEGAGP